MCIAVLIGLLLFGIVFGLLLCHELSKETGDLE